MDNVSVHPKLALSLGEAAAAIGICRRTLENFVAVGKLASRKIGRRRVIRVGDLQKFLRSDHRSPKPTASRPPVEAAQ